MRSAVNVFLVQVNICNEVNEFKHPNCSFTPVTFDTIFVTRFDGSRGENLRLIQVIRGRMVQRLHRRIVADIVV